ncbi:galactose mutarotase-like [Benincasa hispida]|uniref:galactose mutarotase-like n=1 Tax=Benincasa hispida TaxID=102211 RepID=UPI00190299C2|nr:galactose mutarotase-like [Benincasa hispida]
MAKVLPLIFLLVVAAIGFANGNEVGVYKLRRGDFSIKFTNYGATILSVILPDKNGKLGNIVLSFPSIDDFRNDTTYFGNIVGRVANRIRGGQFGIDGVFYKLAPNDGRNLLHGGKKGFRDVIRNVESYVKDNHITFIHDSFDGEQGFPGDLQVSVTYMFIETNKLEVKMEAKSINKPTPVNLAQHSYWNLDGHSSGDILSHKIKLFASSITLVDTELIPTGEIVPVAGTPFNFSTPREIGSQIKSVVGRYDINYVVDDTGSDHLKKVAEVTGRTSGRKMELWSNQPGVQFYTVNQLKDMKVKEGVVYKEYAGLCLETQGFPDSVNHPNFPSQIVKPRESYKHVMVYRFTVHHSD